MRNRQNDLCGFAILLMKGCAFLLNDNLPASDLPISLVLLNARSHQKLLPMYCCVSRSFWSCEFWSDFRTNFLVASQYWFISPFLARTNLPHVKIKLPNRFQRSKYYFWCTVVSRYRCYVYCCAAETFKPCSLATIECICSILITYGHNFLFTLTV